MKLEDQVCSLELAKRLKELGVKQESYFFWHYSVYTEDDFKWKLMHHHHLDIKSKNGDSDIISAYTVAELGEILPNCIIVPDMEPFESYRLKIGKSIFVDFNLNRINNFVIRYECDTVAIGTGDYSFTRQLMTGEYDPNFADAMVKAIIYLIKNGHIDVATINKEIT